MLRLSSQLLHSIMMRAKSEEQNKEVCVILDSVHFFYTANTILMLFFIPFLNLLQLDTKQIEETELVSDVLFCFVLLAPNCDLSVVALDCDSISILLMEQNDHLARRNSETIT